MQQSVTIQSYGENEAKDVALCKRILDALNKYYYGHRWFVNADHTAGTACLFLLYGDNNGRVKRAGCLMHINKIQENDGLKQIMIYGGELLERFGLPRTKASEESAMLARQNGMDMTGMIH